MACSISLFSANAVDSGVAGPDFCLLFDLFADVAFVSVSGLPSTTEGQDFDLEPNQPMALFVHPHPMALACNRLALCELAWVSPYPGMRWL